jgi:hypothetical protein
LVDPFCGVGTSLLAADLQMGWGAARVGVEVNPFAAFAARTKLGWRRYSAERLRRLTRKVLATPLRADIDPGEWPALSTLHDARLFSPEKVSQLVDAVGRIDSIDDPEADLLLLGVAAASEDLSFFRKDGRALRVLRPNELADSRGSLTTERALTRTWARYQADLLSLGKRPRVDVGPVKVIQGDGRLRPELNEFLTGRPVTLMMYSPPYLNHIDYTEVYKVELWLLGFVKKQQEMLGLRKSTFRSHASARIPGQHVALPSDVSEAIATASDIVETSGSRWHNYFRSTANGYAMDLLLSLRWQSEILQQGGQIVCVIGNSSHGRSGNSATIAVDLWYARLAESVGLRVERIEVARRLRRRGADCDFLRESVVVLAK